MGIWKSWLTTSSARQDLCFGDMALCLPPVHLVRATHGAYFSAQNICPSVDLFSYRVLRGGMDMDLNQIVSFAVEA